MEEKKMTLKSKAVLWFVISLILTMGFVTLLTFAYINNFSLWFSLSLLAAAIIMMVSWVTYYLVFSKYKESLDPKAKQKYHKKGNRKESRKSVNRIK
jgi:cation transporter-like permease